MPLLVRNKFNRFVCCKERQKEANNERSPHLGYSSKHYYNSINLNVKHVSTHSIDNKILDTRYYIYT